MKNLKIGDKVDAYEDGKKARKTTVIIDHIIRREDLSDKARRLWKKALNQDFKDTFDGFVTYINELCHTKQFWDWNCDVFIIGHLEQPYGGDDDAVKPGSMLFAKRAGKGMGWYCLNWNYDLDVKKAVRA